MPNADPGIVLVIGVSVIAITALFFWPSSGVLDRIRRSRRQNDRVLTEDALKALSKAEIGRRPVGLTTLAGLLQVDRDRVAAILHDMEVRALVTWEGDQLTLTRDGRDYGLHMLRAHRLLERHLADRTGHRETEWHGLAEMQEHRLTPEDVRALSADLGHPTHDPHGDPIPMADGTLAPHGGTPLTRSDVGACVRIVHLEDEPEAVFAQLIAEGLHPGQELRVLDRGPRRIVFWADGDEHVLAPIVANNISVVSVPTLIADDATQTERLSSLRPGERARVARIAPTTRGPERRRLLDLGFTPGTEIEAELMGMGRDPTAYRVRGALIALRREQAERVHIIRSESHGAQTPG